jgi:hypothetical protein
MKKPESDEQSLAQKIFSGKEILTARPPEMEYDLYRYLLKLQGRILKDLFRRNPDRKLQGIIPTNRNLGYVRKGFKKTTTQRKAS